MSGNQDVAVVGGGILGLAHAYHLARQGMRVVVFERAARASGASIRNFGMLWPIGQPAGERYRLARRSLEIWLEVLAATGLWHARCGSLHLAYHEDEEQVLREFVAGAGDDGLPCGMLSAEEVTHRYAEINPTRLRAGMWSPTEVNVDPQQVVRELPSWLENTFGVRFQYETTVLGFDRPRLFTSRGEWSVPRLIVCTGVDFRELAGAAFDECGLVPCKLQMMRSQSFAEACPLGTMLAAGLTLRHYTSFGRCPSLPNLVRRLDAELPEYGRFGIHVMASRSRTGELVIGDSHEYGAVDPFDKAQIDELILRYLGTFLDCPSLRIATRWHGVYAKHPTLPWVTATPCPGMLAVTGVGGAGMTLSFGLAEQIVGSM